MTLSLWLIFFVLCDFDFMFIWDKGVSGDYRIIFLKLRLILCNIISDSNLITNYPFFLLWVFFFFLGQNSILFSPSSYHFSLETVKLSVELQDILLRWILKSVIKLVYFSKSPVNLSQVIIFLISKIHDLIKEFSSIG